MSRDTVSTYKRGAPSNLRLVPAPRSKAGRIYSALLSRAPQPVGLHNIDRSGAALKGRLAYLRIFYGLDIRTTGRSRFGGPGPRVKHACVGIIDGKVYVDFVANPHLAAAYLTPDQIGERGRGESFRSHGPNTQPQASGAVTP